MKHFASQRDVPPDFPSRIKQVREQLGLSQARFAGLLGVSTLSVKKWEQGQSTPLTSAWQQIVQMEQSGLSDHAGAFGVLRDPQVAYQAAHPSFDFTSRPEVVRAVVDAHRLAYGHLYNPAFATEISLIGPLPHQRLAVYEQMLQQSRLRFLLADDAGAGKTIMSGLYIREMLSRCLIQRVLIVPPAGLVGNWERELRTLFSLSFRIVVGNDFRQGNNPFLGPEGHLLIVSLDTLAGERAFSRLQDQAVAPYDLVIFDEAHKLSADREPDFRLRKTDRYRLAEALAGIDSGDPRWELSWRCQHLLLLTATPHMGKDYPYYCLWRLLEPEALSTLDAFNAYPPEARRHHFIRRTKEEMIYLNGTPIYPTRISDTLSYDLKQGEISEQRLYDETTRYIETYYNRARMLNRSAVRLAMSVFQRRLASSTYALLRSLERRQEKLTRLIEQVQQGLLDLQRLAAEQQRLDTKASPALRPDAFWTRPPAPTGPAPNATRWCWRCPRMMDWMPRNSIREYLGWLEVADQLKHQDIDTVRREMLRASSEAAQRKIPEAIRQAYCIVVTVSEKNEVEAFKVTVGTEPLFTTIKNDKRTRIQETAVTTEALLPGGLYDLWREGEAAHRVKDLVGAFAERPWLPKMLKAEAIRETLIAGCREGIFVLRQMRPDRSYRTFWREAPDEVALKDPGLEAVLPEQATLDSLAPRLLAPGVLPGLWHGPELTVGDLVAYFAGGKVIQVQREGYTEPITLPQASREVIEEAVRAAVRSGQLWLIAGAASLWNEDIPAGLLTDDAHLQERPQPISAKDLLPPNLPEAWGSEITSARTILDALSTKAGQPLPWASARQAIEGAFAAHYLERTLDSGPWPCDLGGAPAVLVRVPVAPPSPQPPPPPPSPPTGTLRAEADLRPHEIQGLADQIGELSKATVGLDITFHLRIELGGSPTDGVIDAVNKVLETISPNLKLH